MSLVIGSRSACLLAGMIAGLCLLVLPQVKAQWWTRAPVDFETCAERAETSPSKAEKTSALAECNAKFAGRRKPGGGYTYYDFLQGRSFDIAGPNPTADEQKKIDAAYATYLANQRRIAIAAEAAARQQQQAPQQVQPVVLHTESVRVPVPVERPKQQVLTGEARTRANACVKGSFSCEWPRLSDSLNELKRLFNPSPAKPKKT
jgi:hypothetical protein